MNNLVSSETLYTRGPLFCVLVREKAIYAVCKRYAKAGFTCMCKEFFFLSIWHSSSFKYKAFKLIRVVTLTLLFLFIFSNLFYKLFDVYFFTIC